MKKLFLSVVCLSAFTSTKAQIAFAPELGLNIANLRLSPGTPFNKGYIKAGTRIGVTIQVPISKHLYLQSGIYYAMNGTNANFDGWIESYDEKFDIRTIEVPAYLLFKIGKPGFNRLTIGIGPYAGYNISGKKTIYGDEKENLHFGSDVTTDDIKAFDYGAGITIGYELPNGLFARAQYQYGFANLEPDHGEMVRSMMSRSYGLQLGYFLSRHHKTETQK